MKLLHALAAVLTVLLLLLHRHAYAGVSLKCVKCRNLFRCDDDVCFKEPVTCAYNCTWLGGPKYKKDPEIDVDNESIGLLPYEHD